MELSININLPITLSIIERSTTHVVFGLNFKTKQTKMIVFGLLKSDDVLLQTMVDLLPKDANPGYSYVGPNYDGETGLDYVVRTSFNFKPLGKKSQLDRIKASLIT